MRLFRRYVLRPFPKKRGALKVDVSEITKDAGKEGTKMRAFIFERRPSSFIGSSDRSSQVAFAD